jgi:hypothetical protein
MEHHYGRHGPGAWLRRRQRRYGRPSRLPVPVEPQPTIVRVFVPPNAERIIIIIMQGTQDPNEENPNREVMAIPTGHQVSTTVSFVPSTLSDTSEMRSIGKDESPLTRMRRYAERQARQDISKIKDLYDEGQFGTLRWDTIIRRNKRLADNLLWEKIYLEDSSPDEQEQEELISAYQQAYRERLDIGIMHYQLGAITKPHVARIRQIAMQDRIDFPPTRRESHRFHQRDLGMIRVLHELEVPLENALDCLPEIHELADEYDKYYANPKEGEDWPSDQEPFPSRNF